MDKSAGKYLAPIASPFPKKMSSFLEKNEKWGPAPFLQEKVACPPFYNKKIESFFDKI